jgi:Carboxypeptidase regulatory-like domain
MQYLPKVDPALLDDLLLRQMENPHVTPMYMIEVFTKPGLNTEEVREYIISKTGMSPAIYDNGTHYVTNQKLTLEMLKEISDSEEVIEVTGDYTGGLGGYGASHEQKHRQFSERGTTSSSISKAPDPSIHKVDLIEKDYEGSHKNNYKVAAYTAAGIIGAIALVGFIISGGMLPNSSSGIQPSQALGMGAGTEPGMLYGYVGGLSGLPAIGSTVIATDPVTGQTTSAFVSFTGQYFINLPPSTYRAIAAFPNGETQVIESIEIARGTAKELNFSYE